MFIERVVLKDFQSHRESVFILNPDLNIISGESGSGKTAFVRAMDYCWYGGKWREEYLRTGAKFCSIENYFSNGTVIKRQKGPGTNRYIVERSGCAPEVYENFGTNIPEVISNALGTQEMWVDKDKSLRLNILNQFEPLFLFTESGSSRVKVLGLQGKINLIDICLRELNKDSRNMDLKVKDLAVRIKGLEAESDAYKDLPSQEAIIGQIGTLIDRIEASERSLGDMESLNRSWVQVTGDLIDVEPVLKSLSGVDFDAMASKLERFESLSMLSISYSQTAESLSLTQKALSEVSNVDCDTVMVRLNSHEVMYGIKTLYDSKCREMESVQSVLSEISRVDISGLLKSIDLCVGYASLVERLDKVSSASNELLLDLASVDYCLTTARESYRDGLMALGKCPTCGGAITPDLIEKHLGEL